MRFSLWLLTHTIYRIRIVGQENVPSRGPALLVCNHLSHVDGAAGGLVRPALRPLPGLQAVLRALGVPPAAEADERDSDRGRPRGARRRIERGARASCRTATSSASSRKGAISRTGNLLPFKRGFERIVDGLDVPIVPVYLDRVWGSIFSFKGGRFFWKWPARVPVSGDRRVRRAAAVDDDRRPRRAWRCMDARLRRWRCSAGRPTNRSARQFVRTAKHHWWSFCMADATRPAADLRPGARRQPAAVALAARADCRTRRTSALLLPASVGGALANIAARRWPARCRST